MNYEEFNKGCFEEAKRLYQTANADQRYVLESLFPELAESRDEKIRKELIEFVKSRGGFKQEYIAWLEKQNKQESITFNDAHIIDSALNDYCCKQYDALHKENGGVLSFARLQHLAMDIYGWCKKQGEQPKKVSIWKHWKDGIAGGSEDEQIFLIKIGRLYSISSCLGCECDYIELSELEKLLSEKQGEQNPANKIEPIFNVGDKIQYSKGCGIIMTIEKIENGEYVFANNMGHTTIEWGNKWYLVEQKPANKVEPKFKVGDYIISNNNSEIIYHITGTGINELGNPDYVCEHVGREKEYNGKIYNMRQDKVDANFRLWTIQDAKDGDVLAVTMYPEGIWIGMFKEHNGCTFSSRCFVNTEGTFKLGTYNHGNGKAIHPATKEQRGLLFQKMHEAGYEWDAEKKELKRIEQKPLQWNILDYKTWQYIVSDVLTKHDGIGQYLDDGFCKKIAKYMQEEWSKRLSTEQKPAWSEDDETGLTNTIIMLKEGASLHFIKNDITKAVDWLKSLKDRYTWKPSNEQMDALKGVQEGVFRLDILESLYNDLMRLKG